MRGDADDVKRDIAALLNGPAFRNQMLQVAGEKQDGFVPQLPRAVYQEERLSHLVFPMAELIVYRTSYPDQDVVKHALVELGVRWTAVARDEKTVTRFVEVLVETTTALLWGKSLQRVNSGPILVTEEDYSPIVPTAEHPYVKSAVVVITVPVWRS